MSYELHRPSNVTKKADYDKARFDRTKRKIEKFVIGDVVQLKGEGKNQIKLDPKYGGPFKVIQILDNDRLTYCNSFFQCFKNFFYRRITIRIYLGKLCLVLPPLAVPYLRIILCRKRLTMKSTTKEDRVKAVPTRHSLSTQAGIFFRNLPVILIHVNYLYVGNLTFL